MAEHIEVDDDGEPKQVTIPNRRDRELDAIEIIINEFFHRLQPEQRLRVARYIYDRFVQEAKYYEEA